MNYDINRDLLPLGTVVKIRLDPDEYVIVGFYPKDLKTGDSYDYMLVRYPKGLIDLDDSIVVNRDYIKKVLHMGYESEEDRNFKVELEKQMASKKETVDVLDF